MAKKVYIDVIVDDKGTTKKVAVDAKKLGNTLGDTAEGAKKAAKSTGELDRNLKGNAKASSNATKNFSKQSQGMGGLVGVYATIAANVFALSAAYEFLKSAADLRVLQDAQVAYSSATGVGLMSLTANIKEATGGLVGFKEAAQAAAIGTASGLNISQIEAFAAGAKNVSLILGRDVTDSFNRLIRGVTKAEPELLDELGITLRLTDATEKYAISLNKTAKELNIYEKSQAVAVEVQSQLDKKYASVAASVELQENAIAKLGKSFEKVINPIKEFMSTIAEPVAEFFSKNIRALALALALVAVPIVKAIIPGLQNWAQTAETSAREATEALAKHREEVEALAQAQAELTASGKNPVASAKEALKGVDSKSKGIGRIRRGEMPEAKEYKALLRQAEKGDGAIARIVGKKMKRQYLAALREMNTGTKKTFTGMRVEVTRFGAHVKLVGERMAAQWQVAMSKMKKATAAFSKFANTAMKAAGLIGVIVMLKDVLVSIAEVTGLLEEHSAIGAFAASLDETTDSLRTTSKEFSKFVKTQEDYFKIQEGLQSNSVTVESLAALGGFIDGNASAFKKSFESMKEYEALQKKLGFTPGATEATVNKVGSAGNRRRRSRKQLAKRSEAYEESGDKNKGTMVGNALAMQSLKGDVDATIESTKELAASFVTGLKASRITSQQRGKDLLDLAEQLAKTGKLSVENQEKFERLSDELVGVGAVSKLAIQEASDLEMQFSKNKQAVSRYTTSVSELIEREEELYALYNTGAMSTVDEGERAKALADSTTRLEYFNKIREKEIGASRRSLFIEQKKLEALKGATPLQAEAINMAAQLATIESSRMTILEDLRIAESPEIKRDQAKIDNLNTQLDILNLQEESLERQASLVQSTLDSMEAAFEGAFQSGLAGLLKGEETSIKEIVGSIAKNVLSSGIDTASKAATKGLMTMFGKDSKGPPEQRIKTAMKEAADYHANQIKIAIGEASPARELQGLPEAPKPAAEKKGFFSTLLGNRREVLREGDVGEVMGADGIPTTPAKAGKAGKGLIGGLENIFGSFKDGIGTMFSKDGGFLKGMKEIFSGGLDGFSQIFEGIGSALQGLFKGGGEGGGLLGGIAGIVGGMFGGPAAGAASAAAGAIARRGGIFETVPGYSTGGIARGREAGYPAVLHGTEAVVPLPNGKEIPVQMQGGAQNTNNVSVNVNMADNQTQSESSGDNMAQFGNAIVTVVQREIADQTRPGGLLAR